MRNASAPSSSAEERAAFLASPPSNATELLSPKWRMAFAAGLVHALHVATVLLGPSALMSPMRAALGVSVTQIALPLNVFRLANAALLIPAGVVLDRVGGARALWPAMLLAACFGLLYPISRSLGDLVVLHVIFAISKLFGGFTAMLMIITGAFGETTGAAASVVLGGYSFAGTITPTVIGVMAGRFGWRVALAVVNTVFAVVGLPLTYFFLRRPVMSAGLAKGKRILVVSGAGVKEPVFTRRYTAVLVMMGALSVSIHIVMDHLIVFLREDVGLSFQRCTMYMSLLNFVALIAKLVAGWWSDRYARSVLFAGCSAVGAVSCFFLMSISPSESLRLVPTEAAVFSFVVLYGFGYSSVFTLITTALGEFGKERMGLRSNLNLMFLFAFGSAGSFAAGWIRTSTGSYAYSFVLNSATWLFIFVCVAVYASGGKIRRSAEKETALLT